MENLEFYQANINDLNSIFQVIETTGWGESIKDIERAILNPSNKYITAIERKTEKIIGTSLTTNLGKVGFIGHVVVLPDYRNLGIGQELMIESINYLKMKGCSTIKLDAVLKAVTLYQRVGFKFELNSLRFSKELTNDQDYISLIKKLNETKQQFSFSCCYEDNLAEIFKVDKEVFGGNRQKYLKSLFEDYPEFTFTVFDKEDFLRGYLFGNFQNGILKLKAGVGDSNDTIKGLIKGAIITAKNTKELKTIKIGILENSQYGINILNDLGFSKVSYSQRMYYGKKSSATINPKIFAIGDPAFG